MTTRIFPCVRCRRPAPKLKVEAEYLCLECQKAFRDYQATETAKAAYNRRAMGYATTRASEDIAIVGAGERAAPAASPPIEPVTDTLEDWIADTKTTLDYDEWVATRPQFAHHPAREA